MKLTDKIEVTCEDNMELMARYPDNYYSLSICDPPYGININTNIGRRKGDKKSSYHKFYGSDRAIPKDCYYPTDEGT